MTIIDTHVHDWSPARAGMAADRGAPAVMHTPHPLTDLNQCIDPDVAGVVLVSADQDSEQENAVLAHLSAHHQLVVATIGHLNLHGDDFDGLVRRASFADPYFRGIRYTLRGHLDGPWTDAATANARHLGAGGFLLEILASPTQLGQVAHIAAAMTEVPIVVDHIATAPAPTQDVESWFTLLTVVAAQPNVTAKLSNFEIPPDADVVARTRRIIDLFGPERLMFASNWPVCLRNGSYHDALRATMTVINDLPTDARESIMYRTAARIFGVETPVSNHEEMHVRRE